MDNLETIENNMKNIKSMEDVPAWATVLINCYTELITEIRSNKKVMELENVCEVRGKIVDALHEDNVCLNAEMENMKFNIDANEQKSRNICLLLHGIPESNNENTDNITLDTIQNEVRVSISLEDIEQTHRVGPRKRPIEGQCTKHRAIIVRFASMRKRMEVYANKKKS